MKAKLLFIKFLFIVVIVSVVFETKAVGLGSIKPVEMEWTVNGVVRKALVYIPESANIHVTPLIFAFHGHGGTMNSMYTTRKFDQLWPEAIFVCPQGLNTPGKLTDPEGNRSGWAMNPEGQNRDIDFFDAMLKTFKEDYKVDEKRIFATGHSNGGGFTYLLWALRGDRFAAFAPTATTAGKLVDKLIPKPVLHLTGEADPLVKPLWQKQTTDYLLKLNQCTGEGKKIDTYTTAYFSKSKNPVLLFSHAGGHVYPIAANQTIITFFKDISK
ncbi:MAG: prolyl oligopeptidase family serine peptidase [Pedobacter sp.]|nr:prolyl oligopeptidase family serine peptidase [Pedobacter sp.]MDQ8054340.1 prolyl oligopeptidase family serine peptidase [Pedobacter sp.]